MSDTDLKVPVKGSPLEKETYKKTYQKVYKMKHKEVTKSLQIQIRSSEYERLKLVAKEEKVPLSKLILNGYYATEKKVVKRSKTYHQIFNELSKIGTNINQIAFQLNSKSKVFLRNPASKFEDFSQAFDKLFSKLESLKY